MEFTRRSFVNLVGTVIAGSIALALGGCGEARGAGRSSNAAQSAESAASSSGGTSSSAQAGATVSSSASAAASSASGTAASDALVVYFSRAGENYGVGYVEEGNTAIVAKMVAERTGADLFEIAPANPYPESYKECCDVALAEQSEKARPAYSGDVDISPYKTVYLGYPIWWGDAPMCVYTFLGSHDWSGKDIRPFCTHAGSGLAGTVDSVKTACAGADVAQGLSIAGATAQNSRDEAKSAVEAWIG